MPNSDAAATSRWLTDDESDRREPSEPSDTPDAGSVSPSAWLLSSGEPDHPVGGEGARPNGGERAWVLPNGGERSRALPNGDEQPRALPEAADDPELASRWLITPGAPSAPHAAVRDLVATRERRIRAVEAYCRELCPPEAAAAAAEAALSARTPADDGELLQATRVAAAKRSDTPAAPRGWREVLAAEHERPCDATPSLLAARENDTLGPKEKHELEQHLSSCLVCQASESREFRAARAFEAVLDGQPADEKDGVTRESAEIATLRPEAPEDAQRCAPQQAIAVAAGAAEGSPSSGESAAAVLVEPRTPRAQAKRRLSAPNGVRLAIAGTALLAAAALAAVLLSGTSSHRSPTSVQAPKPAPPARSARIVHSGRARAHPPRAAHPRHAARHASRARTHVRANTAPAVSVPQSAPPTAVTPAPSAPPTGASLASPTPASPRTASRSVVSVSQPSLPAQSAPEGLGSSTSGH
jgi:hypothetical protein